MRRLTALACATIVLALAGCGGDDEAADTGTSGATGASGATGPSDAEVGATVSARDVESCLNDAGLDATAGGSAVVGIESSHERVDVALEDLDQGAVVIVFESADDAEAEAQTAEVAAGVADAEVAGNTIWGIDSSVGDPAKVENAIPDCLPT